MQQEPRNAAGNPDDLGNATSTHQPFARPKVAVTPISIPLWGSDAPSGEGSVPRRTHHIHPRHPRSSGHRGGPVSLPFWAPLSSNHRPFRWIPVIGRGPTDSGFRIFPVNQAKPSWLSLRTSLVSRCPWMVENSYRPLVSDLNQDAQHGELMFSLTKRQDLRLGS